MICPSRQQLARFEAGVMTPALQAHAKGCRRCGLVMQELAEARQEMLGESPPDASWLAALRILAQVAGLRRERRRRLRRRLPLVLGAAALLAAGSLVLVSRKSLKMPRFHQRVVAPTGPGTLAAEPMVWQDSLFHRTQQGMVLQIQCKRGNSLVPVVQRGEFTTGDQLQFTYTKDEPGYLLIFSVDDAAHIYPHFQGRRLQPIPAPAGSSVPLPYSVGLENHLGWQRIFGLWSQAPLDEMKVRLAVRESLVAANGDIQRATHLGLRAEQVSVLLRRSSLHPDAVKPASRPPARR